MDKQSVAGSGATQRCIAPAMSAGAPPTIPVSLQLYKCVEKLPSLGVLTFSISSSYVVDPIWQNKFTAIWCSLLGAAIIVSLPSLVHAFRQGRALTGFFGLSEGNKGYSAVISEEKTSRSPSPTRDRKIAKYWESLVSVRQWTVPYLELNAGQSTSSIHVHWSLWLTMI